MGVFEIDKTKLSAGCKIVLNYTAVEGDTDVAATQGFNIGLKTGDKWNSPAVLDVYGKKGGSVEIEVNDAAFAKIGAEDKVYMHVSTATAGFKGTFTYTSITVGEDSLVSAPPKPVSYVESRHETVGAYSKSVIAGRYRFFKIQHLPN